MANSVELDCLSCKTSLPRKAFISVMVMGDEYIHSFFLCDTCNEYTVEIYHDRFMGEDSASVHRRSRAEGDRLVKVIDACPTPEDKMCGCAAHREFG